jgi:ribosomal protein S18 acetylase RimI-like enzyme
MVNTVSAALEIDTEPKPEEVRLLEDHLNEFNIAATGVSDGKFLALFLRNADRVAIGGIYGWTWGATCYVRYLYVPEHLRDQGHGCALMRALEVEAKARGCEQIVLETHEFQAPEFYRKLGFEITGRVEDYPRGHQYLTMVKRLTPRRK